MNTIGDKENYDKPENQRDKVIKEVISSEETYLKHLETLLKYFLEPLQINGHLNAQQVKTVFGEIVTIHKMTQELLTQLVAKKTSVGRAFKEFSPYLKLYAVYASNYVSSAALLQKVEIENPVLKEFRKQQETRPEVQITLQSLLIMPIQRLPRYKLLLEELRQHTPEDNEDYQDTVDALKEVADVAAYTNEQLKEWERMQKMLMLQHSLVDNKPSIIVPGRKFVKEGTLMKMSRRTSAYRERSFYLFNDMLMYCKSQRFGALHEGRSLVCCGILPIKDCKVDALGGGGNLQRFYFKITCQNESIDVYTNAFAVGQSWIEAIKGASMQYTQHRNTLRKQSTARRPLRRAAIVRDKNDAGSTPLRMEKRKLAACDDACSLTDMSSCTIPAVDSVGTPVKKPCWRHRVLGITAVNASGGGPATRYQNRTSHLSHSSTPASMRTSKSLLSRLWKRKSVSVTDRLENDDTWLGKCSLM